MAAFRTLRAWANVWNVGNGSTTDKDVSVSQKRSDQQFIRSSMCCALRRCGTDVEALLSHPLAAVGVIELPCILCEIATLKCSDSISTSRVRLA